MIRKLTVIVLTTGTLATAGLWWLSRVQNNPSRYEFGDREFLDHRWYVWCRWADGVLQLGGRVRGGWKPPSTERERRCEGGWLGEDADEPAVPHVADFPSLIPIMLQEVELWLFVDLDEEYMCAWIYNSGCNAEAKRSTRITRMNAAVPIWLLFTALAPYPTWFLARGLIRRRQRRYHGCCRKCRYDLTGNVSGVCPECGTGTPGKTAD